MKTFAILKRLAVLAVCAGVLGLLTAGAQTPSPPAQSATASVRPPAASPALKVLFLGDGALHKPATRLRAIASPLMDRGIQMVYTEDLASLTLENLRRYNALFYYGNIDSMSDAQERALLDYVNQGGGFVAVHAASASFGKSEKFIALVGARFKSHGGEEFTTRVAEPDNPVMQGYTPFKSWDETYVHDKHNETNRTVLEYRDQEPWTWIRTEGKGRVFYTAWGHDERTWNNPGFHELIERGIRYAAGQKLPAALKSRPAMPKLEFVDQAGIPYWPPPDAKSKEWNRMQKPLTPAQSMRRIVVPAGFELQLIASDPDIKKPITMAWDERGRLWIAETLDYPNDLLPVGTKGRDRLVICEDKNNDGKMDTFKVFADGLNIPTSIAFSNGGVIVHQAPETLFLKDTNGDDKADVREVLLRGWSRRDTHAGPSNLNYGFDNMIWGMVGYAGFDGVVGGRVQNFRMGFYRFRPNGSALEFLGGTADNIWGLGLSEEGLVFGSTANGNPSIYLPFPFRYYSFAGMKPENLQSIADTPRFLPLTGGVRQVDVHWGFTAAAGHALYTARSYPKKYWNRVAFVADPTGHLVGQFNLEAKGADFKANNPTNLIVSDDEWFAPIRAEVGPDGSVWIIDWYNYIVQHNPTPEGRTTGKGNAYESELRDKKFGRIYRIVWKGAKPAPRISLAGAKPDVLVKTLASDNLFWRRHAQRLLVERNRTDVVPALLAMVRDQTVDEIGLNAGAIHALWTLHGLRAIDNELDVQTASLEALKHPSAGVRRAALNVMPRTEFAKAAVLNGGLLADSDAQVRLAALIALVEVPRLMDADAETVRKALDTPAIKDDRWCAVAGQILRAVHRMDAPPEAAAAAPANPTAKEPVKTPDGALVLELGVIPDAMKYNKAEITIAAGQAAKLVFKNNDHMQHNALILRPGTIEAVGELADKMMMESDGLAKHYVPDSKDVLVHTPLVSPGQTVEVKFTAPSEPGRYPIVCTFPGHWRIMQATLVVTPVK